MDGVVAPYTQTETRKSFAGMGLPVNWRRLSIGREPSPHFPVAAKQAKDSPMSGFSEMTDSTFEVAVGLSEKQLRSELMSARADFVAAVSRSQIEHRERIIRSAGLLPLNSSAPVSLKYARPVDVLDFKF